MSNDSFPRWLDEHERHAWVALMGTLIRLPAALESTLQRETGMSLFEYYVMSVLSEQPNHTLQLKELAALANASLSRLSHVITRLDRRGWVRRCRGNTARATQARLTERGYEKLVETAPLHVEEVRRLVFDVLTAQQVSALEHITSRINAALGASGELSRMSGASVALNSVSPLQRQSSPSPVSSGQPASDNL